MVKLNQQYFRNGWGRLSFCLLSDIQRNSKLILKFQLRVFRHVGYDHELSLLKCWIFANPISPCMTSIFHILYIQRNNLLVYCYWVCSGMPSYTWGTSKWWICIISNISRGKGLIFCMWVDDHKSNLTFFLNKRWQSWHFKSKLNNSRILPGRSSRTWTIYMFFIEIQVPLDLLLLIWICCFSGIFW